MINVSGNESQQKKVVLVAMRFIFTMSYIVYKMDVATTIAVADMHGDIASAQSKLILASLYYKRLVNFASKIPSSAALFRSTNF